MIVIITGGLGSGKTCLLTRYICIANKLDKKIISNFHLSNIPYEKLDIVDIYLNQPDLGNIFISGDEFYTFMDCRVSGSKRNRLEGYFIAQTRKKNVDLYITSQFSEFVDRRLILFVDIWIKTYNIWIIENGIKKKHPYLFNVRFTDFRDNDNIVVKEFKFDGRRYFQEYNTNERIYPPDDYIYAEKRISKKGNTDK